LIKRIDNKHSVTESNRVQRAGVNMPLTFEHFQKMNEHRCNNAFTNSVQEWTPEKWALAIAGEAGELCNYIKKWFTNQTLERTLDNG